MLSTLVSISYILELLVCDNSDVNLTFLLSHVCTLFQTRVAVEFVIRKEVKNSFFFDQSQTTNSAAIYANALHVDLV